MKNFKALSYSISEVRRFKNGIYISAIKHWLISFVKNLPTYLGVRANAVCPNIPSFRTVLIPSLLEWKRSENYVRFWRYTCWNDEPSPCWKQLWKILIIIYDSSNYFVKLCDNIWRIVPIFPLKLTIIWYNDVYINQKTL